LIRSSSSIRSDPASSAKPTKISALTSRVNPCNKVSQGAWHSPARRCRHSPSGDGGFVHSRCGHTVWVYGKAYIPADDPPKRVRERWVPRRYKPDLVLVFCSVADMPGDSVASFASARPAVAGRVQLRPQLRFRCAHLPGAHSYLVHSRTPTMKLRWGQSVWASVPTTDSRQKSVVWTGKIFLIENPHPCSGVGDGATLTASGGFHGACRWSRRRCCSW